MFGVQRRAFRPIPALITLAVLACIAGGIFALATLPIAPPRQLEVKIRWADRLTEAEKAAAARELGLSLLRVRDDGVWIVQPADTSQAFVRRFVTDPRVADTADVDRRYYRLQYQPQTLPEWLARRGWYPRWLRRPNENQVPGVHTLLAGVLLALVMVRAYPAIKGSALWIFRGVPDLSEHGLALFRIAYGTAMFLAVRLMFIESLTGVRPPDWWAQTALVETVRAHPESFDRLVGAVLVCLVLFTLGLVPRLALAGAAAGLTLLDGILLGHRSIHDWGLPTMTMALMTLAPWHRGFGLSRAIRRWRGGADVGTSLPAGLALWIPAFAIGLAFVAAAYAKLYYSGLAWITGGAVRYHFIDDGLNAPVNWGMRLATSDLLAVAFSFGAIAIEAIVWIVIWFRDWRVRLAFGLVSAGLLSGFFLFQGVFWPAWWTLLLAFLPWSPLAAALVARLPRFTILVDGECPICRRTARVLDAMDWFDRLTFSDASDDEERARVAPDLDRGHALAEMHVIDERGRRTAGYDAYLRIAASLPLLWIPRIIGAIPWIAAAGRARYRRIASSRARVGRCTDAVCDPSAAPLPRRRGATAAAARLSPLLPVVFGLVLGQQILVSWVGVESQPFVSNFPMYSHTYQSREAFDVHLRGRRAYTLATPTLNHDQIRSRLVELCDPGVVIEPALDAVIDHTRVDPAVAVELRRVLRLYEQKYGMPLDPVYVRRTERRFDWQRGELDRTPRVTFEGTVDLSAALPGV